MKLGKYSMGIGDRFSQQGRAQLSSFVKAKSLGIEVIPIWNKSHREHGIVKSVPGDVRIEADRAVRDLGWDLPYYVDADHINLGNVDSFVDSSDFFTIDVADYTGQPAEPVSIDAFVEKHRKRIGTLSVLGIDETFDVTEGDIISIAETYLLAVQEAGKIYRHIENTKGRDNFITEVSMDETDLPQTPLELFFILAGLSDEGVPVQTVAPKFTGRFNKGVDYVGDLSTFKKEFNQDLAVIAYAVREFDLPENLKLSIHSGSDKFSIYGPINQAMKKFKAGLHLKTAGTTWLEEIIGLAEAGGEGLEIAKEVYKEALGRFDELCTPYATVIDIDKEMLPTPEAADGWSSDLFANSLRHNPSHPEYNNSLRQLIHIGYKVASEMGDRYLSALKRNEDIVGRNVAENIYERHFKPVFF